VSHDRYFVDRLATKVVSVGHGGIEVYPGTYEEFLWSRGQRTHAPPAAGQPAPKATRPGNLPTQRPRQKGTNRPQPAAPPAEAVQNYADKKRVDAQVRRQKRADDERQRRVADLEARITERERAIKEIEAQMAAPGFYENRQAADVTAARHHQLMWEVGDLMHQWETLQETRSGSPE
jgi:ATP-binding cassette subfamily F protein 3